MQLVREKDFAITYLKIKPGKKHHYIVILKKLVLLY